MKTTKQLSTVKQEIYVNEIEFYSRSKVYLYGFVFHGGTYREAQFVINRQQLSALLSQNRKTGTEILWLIERLFVLPHAAPATINLVEAFGTTQMLRAACIELEMFFEEETTLPATATPTCGLVIVNRVAAAHTSAHQ